MSEIENGSQAEQIQNSDYWKRIRERMREKTWMLLVEAGDKNLDPTPLAYMASGFQQIERLMCSDIDDKKLALKLLREKETSPRG
ncbi:MAG: hypothetical protein AB2793_16045 [Candidatus Thiodiazotropha sp.]